VVQPEKKPVKLFEHLDEFRALLGQKDVFIFLDYDGTLTPIVDTPDLAVLSPAMRATAQNLATHYKVSIVSGRATDDVQSKVQIDGIFYAGSHGFEIVDPLGNVTVNESARAVPGVIDRIHRQLSEALKGVKGALVEHVKYTLSAHYRLVSEQDFPRVRSAVAKILEEYPDFRRTDGKKVFEIRPRIDWDKGKAVDWILNVLRFDPAAHLAVYVGDDVTDEDAFAALEGKGIGILVADPPRASKARYCINDTADVQKLLEFFVRRKAAS